MSVPSSDPSASAQPPAAGPISATSDLSWESVSAMARAAGIRGIEGDEGDEQDENDEDDHDCGYGEDYSSDSDEEGELRSDRVIGKWYKSYGTGEEYQFTEERRVREQAAQARIGSNQAEAIGSALLDEEEERQARQGEHGDAEDEATEQPPPAA